MSVEKLVQKIFERMGYQITKKRTYSNLSYTRNYPFSYSTYSPWFEEGFQMIYRQIKDVTLVKEDRCYTIYKLAEYCRHLAGDFAECGVYKGGTAFIVGNVIIDSSESNKQFHLFDTFSGMPSIADKDPSPDKSGDFKTSLSDVKKFLEKFPFINFYDGIIPDVFRKTESSKFAFVHIDVDLYKTTKDCCEFFYDKMTQGGIMIFDDYGFPGYENAAKKAVDEFFSNKKETLLSLHTGQCIVIKL